MFFRSPLRAVVLLSALMALGLGGLASPLSSQEIGGGWEVMEEFPCSQSDDEMGWSVSSHGRLDNRILVGAPSMGLHMNGMVWWYAARNGAVIGAFLGTGDLDGFGWAVADAGLVDGDALPDILIGAPYSDSNGLSSSGAALVYSSATGLLIHRFNGQATWDKFGEALCSVGDVDGDGLDDLLIGAPSADPSGLRSAGSAYLYSGSTGALIRQFDGLAQDEELGAAVAGPGDLDGDGVPDLLIGAPGVINGQSRGAAFLYSGATGALIYRVDAGGGSRNYRLGAALGLADDLDGDGVTDFLVGDPEEEVSVGGGSPGGATLISGATGLPLLSFHGELHGDLFGTSLAGGKDLNADGFLDLAIGALEAWGPGNQAQGAVYLYSGADGSLIRRLDPPGPGSNWYSDFGIAVALVADQDGDARAEVLVGAPYARGTTVNADGGAAYLLDHDHWISPTSDQLSATGPDWVHFSLSFPASEAGLPYVLFFSRYGSGPTHYAGLDVPLTWDPVQRRIAQGWQPSFVSSGTGNLGMFATGSIGISSDPALLPLVGQTLHTAVLTYDLPSRIPRLSSTAVAIEILP